MNTTARLIGLLILALPGLAVAQSSNCEGKNNNTFSKLLECVTVDGVRAHQAVLQGIADDNNGIRASGTPGYDDSVDYIVETMTAAGYAVSVQEFQFETFIPLGPTILEQVSPPPAGPIDNIIMAYSGSGDVTAPVTALPGPLADATPGCEAADFAGFTVGNIALISRGACTFAVKATNAYNAGASGVVIYNNQAGVINGTLGNDFTLNIPVTSVTQAVGQQLAATPGLVLRLKTDTFRGLATTSNVLAESAAGDPDNVVMVGAHLDSFHLGPGINGNGSGVAVVLEVARQLAKVKPRNKLRFAWWGSHESGQFGLDGSYFYVDNLSEADRARVALYIDANSLGSPNYGFFVFDGDGTAGGSVAPEGSAAVEETLRQYFAGRGIPVKEIDPFYAADSLRFFELGIPIGALTSGDLGIKTADEALLWGGIAGVAYDPCDRLACDTFDNVSLVALDHNANAIAYATLQYAMSTADVNGAKGKGNFNKGKGKGKGKGKPASASTLATQ